MAAGLSQAQLARMAGLCRGTITNAENSSTAPSRETRERLAGVLVLGMNEPDIADHVDPGTVFSPQYDPLVMARDMHRLLNGPGGTLEQTYAYIDPQSAADWYDYANLPTMVEQWRNKLPVADLVAAALGRGDARGLDLVSLGVGDGKSETRLAEHLLEHEAPDLRVYYLDISHSLLVEAYKQASIVLRGRAPIFPIHGNFLALRSVIPLAYRTEDRRRLWTMIGNTFGNLDHEPRFLADLTACSRTGDLLLLDVQLAYAPAWDLAAIRAGDPVMAGNVPAPVERWLTGPVRRHCRNAADVSLGVEVSLRCPLPGSYQLNFIASATPDSGPAVRHHLFLARRYTLEALGAELADLGWRPLFSAAYGPGKPQHAGCLLLERT